jgi:hypothetical protein
MSRDDKGISPAKMLWTECTDVDAIVSVSTVSCFNKNAGDDSAALRF